MPAISVQVRGGSISLCCNGVSARADGVGGDVLEFFLPEYFDKLPLLWLCGGRGGSFGRNWCEHLNPIQGKANVKRNTFGKTALRGGVDSATIMLGTPEEVRKEALRVMEILKPGGGYICGPDQWLPNFPKENIDELYKTASEFGLYS